MGLKEGGLEEAEMFLSEENAAERELSGWA